MAKNITGTLKYLESGQLVTDWGEGNFLALKFINNDPDKIKTIKVGLDPSQSSGLVPLDEDMNGVFKITNKDTQKFVVESYGEEDKLLSRDEYDLSGLWCKIKEVKLDITSEVESSYTRGSVIPLTFEYDLKDIVEPENAVIKVGYRSDYNDEFIKTITPQTASGTITTSVNTNDMLFIYNTDIVVSVFNADGTVSYATDRTNTFEITEPTGPTTITFDESSMTVMIDDTYISTVTVENFNEETMEITYESADEGIVTIAPYTENPQLTHAFIITSVSEDETTVTAYVKDKTSHEVIASDTATVHVDHPTDPYFEFQSEDVTDGGSYADDYCENGKTMHVIAFNHAYESADEVYVKTTPENTSLTITKEIVNPETANDDCLITVSGVNSASEDITIEVGDTYYGSEEALATFTIKGQPARPEFHSNDFENGGLYTGSFFSTGKDFTIENVEAGDTIALTFDHTSAMPMLTGSISGTTYSGRINGPNVSDNILAASITVNGTSVCDFTIYVSNSISISENEIDVNETKDITVSLTKELPTNFIITATPSGGTITVDNIDQTNRKITISGVSSGNSPLTIVLEDTDENNFEFASNRLIVYTNPVGSTATPTDNVQTLLQCAGIYNKDSYTTISDVISDTDTLSAVIANHNAIDYLVRSTTFASAVTADQTAMTDIGADNYAADTLLGDSTWLSAIYGSFYSSSVLNSKVPQMTSNTAPSGVVTVSGTYGGNWKSYGAFNDSYEWYGTNNNNQFVQYEFPEAMTLKAFEYQPSTNAGYAAAGYTITLTGSNDGTNFTQLATHSGITGLYRHALPENKTAYKYYKMHILCENPGQYSICPNAHKIQYYGRKDV